MVAILILASWCRTRWRSFKRRVEGWPFLSWPGGVGPDEGALVGGWNGGHSYPGQVVLDEMREL